MIRLLEFIRATIIGVFADRFPARVPHLPDDRAIIDGGILAPERLGISRLSPSDKPVVVPHWQSLLVGGWETACDLAGFLLSDPMRSPMMVIGSIASAPLVLTGSLHGAIIADDPPPITRGAGALWPAQARQPEPAGDYQ